jgi:hypothetical protein
MFVVTDESELNWWLRRFATRISMRLSPDFVEMASARGTAHSAAVLSVIHKGDRMLVAGIGNEPVADVAANRIAVFQAPGPVLTPDDAVARFLCVLLRRLPPSGGFIRPVVIVDGLRSLENALGGQHQAIVTRALSTCGAAAVVIRNGAA